MARARDIANIINSGTFLTPAGASATYSTKIETGLVHIETINPSSSTSINFSNNVLSSTYDRYLITGTFVQNTSAGDFLMRGRTSGTSNSGSNYIDQNFNVVNNSITAVRATSQTSWEIIPACVGFNSFNITLFNFFPNDTRKGFIAQSIRATNTTSFAFIQNSGGWTGTDVSFDSVEFLTGAGSISGEISLYGYKE